MYDALNVLYVVLAIFFCIPTLFCCLGSLCCCFYVFCKDNDNDSQSSKDKFKLDLTQYKNLTKDNVSVITKMLESPNTNTLSNTSITNSLSTNNANNAINQEDCTYFYYHFDTVKGNSNDEFDKMHEFLNILLSAKQSSSDMAKNTKVLLHITSPGGKAGDFEKLYTHIKTLTDADFEFTALVDECCCSGGYMIACACKRIIASETAKIGSIGVFAMIPGFKDLSEKVGVNVKTFKTALNKTYPIFDLATAEDDKAMQKYINYTFNLFKDIVKTNRPTAQIDEVATAEVWYGKDALTLKLIDQLDTVENYINTLIANGVGNNSVYVATISHIEGKSSKKKSTMSSIDVIKKIMSIFKKLFSYGGGHSGGHAVPHSPLAWIGGHAVPHNPLAWLFGYGGHAVPHNPLAWLFDIFDEVSLPLTELIIDY